MAIEFSKNALQLNDNSPQIYALLADSYCCTNNYDKAQEIYENCDLKQFDNEKLYASWGENAFHYKDYEKSIYAYNKALKINPDSIIAKDGLASNYISTNKFDEAKKVLTEISDKVKDKNKLYIKLAHVENALNNYSEAIKYIIMAIKENADNVKLYYDLGLLYEKTGELDKAKTSYTKMLEYFKDNYDACYRYAKLSYKDNPKDALRKIRTAYNADKNNYEYIKLYSEILAVNEMYKGALEVVDAGLEIYKNDFELIYLKIRLLLNINKYNNAIDLLYGLPQERKDNENFDYLLLWAYIIRANDTNEQSFINEMNDFSYYLSQKYGKNHDFMVKLKSLEDKYKQKD